ncbi:Tyrosinase [Corchorus capsularis]|uniref:Tyrosinase n=1 Tax=Corchorus capsularis TaxID=210143 RepID=A0A1R3I1W8_COCAP|nr:Tyrosinase [Corchorus capsularis]
MASSPFLSSSTPPTSTVPNSSTIIQTSFFPKTTQLSINKKLRKPYHSAPNKVAVSCKATNNGNQQNPTPSKKNAESALNRFDRRDVLIGLGGLYGATNLAGGDPFALAAPIEAPDLTLCGEATVTDTYHVYCCPPTSEKIIDFTPPSFKKLRFRPAAHLVTDDYLVKFKTALQKMKDLPDDDPRSFKSQAEVHCAYCNGAYDQVGFPDQNLQVHFSWLFQPFHRFYLYFYERILGTLIDDPEFAIPFWNWDTPDGMPIPAIYNDPSSPLYDSKRNVAHLPPVPADLDFNGTDRGLTAEEQIQSNLKSMYRQMVSNSKTASLFHGEAYRAGDAPSPGMGSIENIPHTPIHRWVGDPREDNGEDMGNFYSAGRDPLFYAHHGNVDRMWALWKQLPGKKRTDFTDTDWLDSSFVFYDENKNLIRCKVRDCLETKTLGYAYQPVDIPWLKSKPNPRKYKKKKGSRGVAKAAGIKSDVIKSVFPIVLNKIVRVEVPRPRTKRSKYEKEDEEEVLVIQNIKFKNDEAVKFDVYINDEDDETPTGPQDSEFAGSFSSVPHRQKSSAEITTGLKLGLTDLLEDLDVEGDDSIIVTLVPRTGKVTIGGLKIDFVSS